MVLVSMAETYSLNPTQSLEAIEINLSQLDRIAQCFGAHIGILRLWNDVPIVTTVLKYARLFLQSLVKSFPTMSSKFVHFKESIAALLKVIQTGTRTLQNLCNDYKVNKDETIRRNIPLMRKMMETLLYQVKRIMVDNNLLDGFFLGNLKHRALTGEVIGSQLQIPVSSGEDEEDNHV